MVVLKDPHKVNLIVKSSEVINGIMTETVQASHEVKCYIEHLSQAYTGADIKDKQTARYRIFCDLFDNQGDIKIGDSVEPITGITGFDEKQDHRILSFIIHQTHIEIEV